MKPSRRSARANQTNYVRPSLALDPAGNPRVGFDAEHYGTEVLNGVRYACNYKDVNVTRLALFDHTTTGLEDRPELPASSARSLS